MGVKFNPLLEVTAFNSAKKVSWNCCFHFNLIHLRHFSHLIKAGHSLVFITFVSLVIKNRLQTENNSQFDLTRLVFFQYRNNRQSDIPRNKLSATAHPPYRAIAISRPIPPYAQLQSFPFVFPCQSGYWAIFLFFIWTVLKILFLIDAHYP